MKKKFYVWTIIAAMIFWGLPCLYGILLESGKDTNWFMWTWVCVDTAAFIVLGIVSGIWIKDMFLVPIISYAMYVAGVCLYWAVFDSFAFMYLFGVMLMMTIAALVAHFVVGIISLLAGVGIGFAAEKIKRRQGSGE